MADGVSGTLPDDAEHGDAERTHAERGQAEHVASKGGHAERASSERSNHADGWASSDLKTQAATIGVVVVGAALIEAALIPGIVIGLAAAVAPKYMPQMGAALQPMFRSAVRGAYKFGRRAREAAAEATEQVQDIVAEVHAEGGDHPDIKPHA